VKATIDRSREQVHGRVTLKDGRRIEKFIEHVVGSVERPLSDADLEAKFMGLVAGVLPAAQALRLRDLCWKVETLPRAAALATAARVVGQP
jgi:2-methylcitrate dehydratase PrpD